MIDRVSLGPAGGNGAFPAQSAGISQDGAHVFFQSAESLVGAGTNNCSNVYDRAGGTTTLVSTGESGPGFIPNACDVFGAASEDGTRVLFSTQQAFTTTSNPQGDTDGGYADVYERSGGTTTQISVSSPQMYMWNGPHHAGFLRASQDASRVFFQTDEPLVFDDANQREDIYERSGGITRLVSTGSGTGQQFDNWPVLEDISADGTRAFFTTYDSLVVSDADSKLDVYERSAGTTTLVSTGPGATGGSGPYVATFAGASADGSRVFFITKEQLVNADTDAAEDVYERSAGTTTLVSTGPAGGSSPAFNAGFGATSQDGTRVFFTTADSIVSGDTDGSLDIYERSGGTTTLISVGTGADGSDNVAFVGVTADGARVLFTTSESLIASDTDSTKDIYERARAG